MAALKLPTERFHYKINKRPKPRMPANQLLSDIDCGGATAELIPLVYDELRRLAARYLRRERSGISLQPTALVHEAYLELNTFNKTPWQNRAQFFRVASQVMRRILM